MFRAKAGCGFARLAMPTEIGENDAQTGQIQLLDQLVLEKAGEPVFKTEWTTVEVSEQPIDCG